MSHERVRSIGKAAVRFAAATALTFGPSVSAAEIVGAQTVQTTEPAPVHSNNSGPLDSPVPGMIQEVAGVATLGFVIRNRARSAQLQETMSPDQKKGDKISEVLQDTAAITALATIITVASRL